MGSFGQRLRRERGAVAVEFALIMPVLFLILFGTLEFGRAWSQVQVFNGAAREGARCSAVLASKVTTCTVVGRIEDASGSYSPNLSTLTVTPSGGCTDATRGQETTVSWVQPVDINIPFWSDVMLTPTISATFRCE